MNTKVIPLIIAITIGLVACNYKSHLTSLSGKNWDPFNKAQIEQLINTYGKASDNYNASAPPYVVFDWDNTSIFLDIEEATLMYQLKNLLFACTPGELDTILHIGIDTTIVFKETNTLGKKFNINKITADICGSYTWLYNNYELLGNKGKLKLEEVKKNPHYDNFITKVRFLYEAISETFSDSIAYPWVTYLFAGLDSSQVRSMTRKTVEWQTEQLISIDTLTSPLLPDQLSGQVQVTWKNGLRLLPEMQELYTKFRQAGFDVWVCSASFVDVIKEISSNPVFGYNNSANHVIAMELERDPNGKILPEFRNGYVQTQGRGKTSAIKRFLANPGTGRYGYQPIFIAGDSSGDENMLNDFDSLKIGLIINRLKDKYEKGTDNNISDTKGIILGKLYQQADSGYYKKSNIKYLIQGRDDNNGSFIPNREHIKFGTVIGKVFSSD